jgi:hypothetical protein
MMGRITLQCRRCLLRKSEPINVTDVAGVTDVTGILFVTGGKDEACERDH